MTTVHDVGIIIGLVVLLVVYFNVIVCCMRVKNTCMYVPISQHIAINLISYLACIGLTVL